MAQPIPYHLDNLGCWLQFENLVQELLLTDLGLGVEAWGGSADHGKDAYCETELNFPNKHTVNPGPFIFQTKFIAGANAAGARFQKALTDAVAKEATLIQARIRSQKWEWPQHYGLFTNAPLTAGLRDQLRRQLRVVLPKTGITIQGASSICGLLDKNISVARAFPQILSLRNFTELLEKVVRNGSIQRSEAVIGQAQALTDVFVPTNAYERSWQVLGRHNFVVLEGPPEMGKTAIAWMIAAVQLTQNWEAIDCDNPDDFFTNYFTDRRQIFVADDAFGETEYEAIRGNNWGRQMHKVLPKLDRRHWLLWTSRMHILQKALLEMSLQGCAAKFPKPAEVVVNANNLEPDERAVMLYRHARAARLEESGKSIVRQHASEIIDNPHFTPQRIKGFVLDRLPDLAKPRGSGKLSEDAVRSAVKEAIERPTERMRKAFAKLDPSQKWLLIALLDCDRFPNLNELETAYRRFCELHRPIASEAQILEEGFLKANDSGITWIHPSYRDLVIEELENDGVSATRFLERCSITGLDLAISVAGGATGERRFPLMKMPNSWQIVGRRFVDMVGSAVSQFDIYAVLQTLRSATQSSEDSSVTHGHLLKIMDACCVEGKKKLDEIQKPIISGVLEEFLSSTMYLDPPPPMPAMSESLRTANKRFDKAIGEAESGQPLEANPVTEWAGTIKIIAISDQRILRQFEYPDEYERRIGELCSIVKAESEGADVYNDPDDCNSASERIRAISLGIRDLIGLLPKLDGEIEDAANAAESYALELERRYRNSLADPTDDEPDELPKKRESIDLERLFADL